MANAALSKQITAISAAGGQVHKFLDDGLLAVFDGSRKAERALEAAAAIHANRDQSGMPALGGRRIEIGIGLTFGEVIMSGALFEQMRGRLTGAQSRAVNLKGIADVSAYAISGQALQRVLDANAQGQVPIFDDSRPDTIPLPSSAALASSDDEVDPVPGPRLTVP